MIKQRVVWRFFIMYSFIVNPNSRSGEGRNVWNRLRSIMESQGISYQYFLTEYVGHATVLAQRISAAGTPEDPVTLVTVGGDGTIYEVLTGIIDLSSVVFGFIPVGSGNDFCRSMGLPFDPFEALRSILENRRTISMDVPILHLGSHSYRFGISAGIGYDAAICQEVLITPGKKFLNRLHMGKLIYLMVALKQFLFLTPSPITLTLDGNKPQTFSRTWFAAVMNQKYEGGGFKFCPDASPEDGLLDVIVIEGISKLKMLFCLPSALWGKHTHIRGVHILQCRNVHITSAHSLPVHKDGESGGIQREFSVTIEKKPLKIIMPVL